MPVSFIEVIVAFIFSLLQDDDKGYCGEGQELYVATLILAIL